MLPLSSAFKVVDAIKSLQESSGGRVRSEELSAARESVRLEVQRLFFTSFLDSSDGQVFVINALQDGTLCPAEVRSTTERILEKETFVTRAYSVCSVSKPHESNLTPHTLNILCKLVTRRLHACSWMSAATLGKRTT